MTVREGVRIAQLELEIRALKDQLAAKPSKAFPCSDPAFKLVSFLGSPARLARRDMIAEMECAARERFPECKPVVTEIRYKGPYGKREATFRERAFRLSAGFLFSRCCSDSLPFRGGRS